MSEKSEAFQYTYSSKQQQEVKKIRDKYLPRQEDKMEQLRRLDESAARPGKIAGLTLGILSALILGVGMCCTMVWPETLFIPGIVIGLVGIAGVLAAYPLYSYLTKKRRERLAPEILRLTDELLK